MYNYFCSQKKQSQKGDELKEKEKENKAIREKKKKIEKLLKGFVDRTMRAVNLGVGEYEPISKYSDPTYKPRPFDKSKNIGPPSFYFRDRSSLERVKEAVKKNEDLDEVPFQKRSPSASQFREVGEGISMKYTPINTSHRVMESVKHMRTNEIPSSWDIGSSLKNSRASNRSKDLKQSSVNPKAIILPSLTEKRHPKSFESIKNKLEVGSLKSANEASRDLETIEICQTLRAERKKKGGILKIDRSVKRVKFDTMHVDRNNQSHFE